MDQFREVLLDLWREACRHILIAESTANFTTLLAKHLPVASLVVRRLDATQHALETVATGFAQPHASDWPAISHFSPPDWKQLRTWLKTNEVLNGSHEMTDKFAGLAPYSADGSWLAGPLQRSGEAIGVLVLIAPPKKIYTAVHEQMVSQVLEPFSVALDNDRRLHELTALREAAEAERRSLLSRLGRQDVNEVVVGAQTGLRHVMERVELVAKSDVPVLILGETGTGKEVVSRAIHTRSPRREGPFIRVNCGAIPPELIDSQLFGHEKGSFTGATDQHQGWFERADGGTLFLDEIGELPLPAQVRLLRVLQDHHVERVGGKQSIHVDVRIVAATHRDLATMVKARGFREDLWYRINVFPILLPRLRERLDDIPALVKHFAQRAANRFGLPYVEPTAQDLSLLLNYSWPGNIRELGAVIDRASILGNGRTLEVAKSLGLNLPTTPTPAPTHEPTYYEVIPEAPGMGLVPLNNHAASDGIVTLDLAMRQHIERALSASRGKIEGKQGAAAMLGINPHTLRARMRKLGLEWNKFRGF